MKKKAKSSSKRKTAKKSAGKKKKGAAGGAFAPRPQQSPFAVAEKKLHVFGDKQVCGTESRGYPTPGNRSPLEIVVDASEGFIPLWARNMHLRWRFNEASMGFFQNPTAAKQGITDLMAEAILQWGDAAPIEFKYNEDVWDFELVMRSADNCNAFGCTLASAFFPDSGRHQLTIYPRMFTQDHDEQVETFIHEIGHVFGLRHFFANVSETAWPSEIFGTHEPFTIMNYGAQSVLTDADRDDLSALYQQVWSGELTKINGTPIVQVKPFHTLGAA